MKPLRFLAPSLVALLAIAMVLGAYSISSDERVAFAQSTGNPTPLPNCPVQVPVGQANPSAEPEPMGQVWCFPLVAEPTTRVTGANDWVDTFNTNVQMGHLNDGEMGYRVFTPVFSSSNAGTIKSQIFVNNNHWMPDIQMLPDASGGTTSPEAGVMLSPNRSFHAENGKLVVEADVAVTTDAQGGADNFIELDVAPSLPGTTGLDSGEGRDYYGYGNFAPGAVGCRIEKGGTTSTTIPVICSLMGSWTLPLAANNTAYYPGAPCASTPNPSGTGWNCLDNVNAFPNAKGDGPGMRLWESQSAECLWLGGCTPGQGDMLSNVVVGTTLHGSDFARVCQPNQMDMFCRDRWRLEITKTTLTLFVNGGQVLQLGPFPTSEPTLPQNCDPTCYSNPQAGRNAQIRDAILNNAYVYYTTWVNYIDGPGQPALTRTHWGRVAVNPHNADGSFAAPSAAPSYCFGMPQNTCAMGGGSMPAPTPMPTSMPMASSPTAVPTKVPTLVPTTVPTAVPTVVASPMPVSAVTQKIIGFDDLTSPNRVLSGQYPTGVIDWGTNG